MKVIHPTVDGAAGSFTYPFPMFSGTATVLVIQENPLNLLHSKFLVAKRAQHVKVFPGMDSIPGGFINARITDIEKGVLQEGETAQDAALRELYEEIRFRANIENLNLFNVDSDPLGDPRNHNINVCFWTTCSAEEANEFSPDDDIESISWAGIEDVGTFSMAFNHSYLVRKGLKNWAAIRGLNISWL